MLTFKILLDQKAGAGMDSLLLLQEFHTAVCDSGYSIWTFLPLVCYCKGKLKIAMRQCFMCRKKTVATHLLSLQTLRNQYSLLFILYLVHMSKWDFVFITLHSQHGKRFKLLHLYQHYVELRLFCG